MREAVMTDQEKKSLSKESLQSLMEKQSELNYQIQDLEEWGNAAQQQDLEALKAEKRMLDEKISNFGIIKILEHHFSNMADGIVNLAADWKSRLLEHPSKALPTQLIKKEACSEKPIELWEKKIALLEEKLKTKQANLLNIKQFIEKGGKGTLSKENEQAGILRSEASLQNLIDQLQVAKLGLRLKNNQKMLKDSNKLEEWEKIIVSIEQHVFNKTPGILNKETFDVLLTLAILINTEKKSQLEKQLNDKNRLLLESKKEEQVARDRLEKLTLEYELLSKKLEEENKAKFLPKQLELHKKLLRVNNLVDVAMRAILAKPRNGNAEIVFLTEEITKLEEVASLKKQVLDLKSKELEEKYLFRSSLEKEVGTLASESQVTMLTIRRLKSLRRIEESTEDFQTVKTQREEAEKEVEKVESELFPIEVEISHLNKMQELNKPKLADESKTLETNPGEKFKK
jgi:hypothetical protein